MNLSITKTDFVYGLKMFRQLNGEIMPEVIKRVEKVKDIRASKFAKCNYENLLKFLICLVKFGNLKLIIF